MLWRPNKTAVRYVLGLMAAAGVALFIVLKINDWLEGLAASRIRMVRSEMARIGNVLDVYSSQSGRYPSPTAGRALDKTVQDLLCGAARTIEASLGKDLLRRLCLGTVRDPFSSDNRYYLYVTDGDVFVLGSVGPNKENDTRADELEGVLSGRGDLRAFLSVHSYDPTNGTCSSGGEIFLTKSRVSGQIP